MQRKIDGQGGAFLVHLRFDPPMLESRIEVVIYQSTTARKATQMLIADLNKCKARENEKAKDCENLIKQSNISFARRFIYFRTFTRITIIYSRPDLI